MTLMLGVVAPVLHENVVPPLAVSVTFSPLQTNDEGGVIRAVGD